MNDQAMNQLKVIVERAVRPVRASTSAKGTMREELLAHVTAVFEEEAKLNDEPTALDRTARRFGSPNELTGQLQQSVPAGDGIHCFLDKLWFRPGEPWARRVCRYLVMWSLILVVFVPSWYVWVQVCEWTVRASNWPAEEERGLFGGPVLLFDVIFSCVWFVILDWGLVKLAHQMTARIRSHQEWARLEIDQGPTI